MKTRFCPSPTGHIHLGNARTALFCYLLAQKDHGKLLLRIEDTDQERSEEVYTQQLMEDLKWLGILWQEGPEVGGEAGPYWQSQRQEIYDQYYRKLEALNLVYPCFCTQQQLAISRKIQLSQGKPPRYAGTCYTLSAEERAAKIAEGIQPTLRFRIPNQQYVKFVDLVKGEQCFNTNDIGDFVIRRADGTAPFLFCNAIDDAAMDVTHVLRGEDHLANTPRQILILNALNLPVPNYGHISLILNPQGGPLSKREGSRSIKELRETGFLSLGITNYLARLGHYYKDNHFLALPELAQQFNCDNLGKAPARFDQDQLLYWQHEAVAHTSVADLWQWAGVEAQALVPQSLHELFMTTIKANVTFPADLLHWAKVLFADSLQFNDEAKQILSATDKAFFTTTIAAIDEFGCDYEKICEKLKLTLNVKGKALFQPLRLALTAEMHGPELKNILQLLGPEKAKQRLTISM
jgi:glutamyl-tRNA synthetase